MPADQGGELSRPTKAQLVDALAVALEGLQAVLDDSRLWNHDYGCGCLMYGGSCFNESKRVLERAGGRVRTFEERAGLEPAGRRIREEG
jgi:hypothetical protein